MWDSEDFSCRDCHMAFRSGGLLDKHKARFCLGSDIGDPAVLRRGRVEFAKPETSTWRGQGPYRTSTPDLICPRERKAERTRQSKPQNKAGDVEFDTLRERDHQGCLSDSVALTRLTNEFHKLRMSIQESIASLPLQQVSESISAVAEASQMAQSEKLREMSEHHGHQLAAIRAHTDHLEQQKEEIERRLAALAGVTGAAHLESLLQELREQEGRNEEALQHLRTQISTLQAQQEGAKDADTTPDFPEDRGTQRVTFDLISSVDGPLSNQIRSLRLAYMQSGGSDPEILAQMHDLQAEAHTLEQTQLKQDLKIRKKRVKPRTQAADSELTTLELDNQRLQEEIFRMQWVRQRQRGEEGAELQLMQRQQLQQLAGLQGEIESLRREVERTRAHRQVPPPPPPPLFPGPAPQLQGPISLEQCKAQTSLLSGRLRDPRGALGPAPYDPAAGFVIFYDMLVGVDATLTALRLVVGLFSLGQELGRPTPLPTVPCQPAGSLPYPYSLPTGNYAILSAKQPVPRMQPSPSLSLLVEVQAAGGVDPSGQEIQDLVSCGWTQLQLFDQHNQVLSGHWRVPFRVLPVQPSLSPGQLNSVSQLGNMELCLRLANARDGEVQSLAKIDPSDTSHYTYPALTPVPYGALQPTTSPALSPSVPVDQVDPPTVEESKRSDLEAVRGVERKMEGFGVIVDRVRGAPSGQGSLRLTGYSLKSGQVIMCGVSAVLCCTSTVSSCIKHENFIYGEQQACFPAVQPREDMILILRFYHLPADGAVLYRSLLRQREVPPWETGTLAGNLSKHEECVVAWGAIRLTRPESTSQGSRGHEKGILWNTGTHLVPLYCTPVPPVVSLSPLPDDCLIKSYKPYGAAKIRLHIYSGQAPPFPVPPESPVSNADPNPPTNSNEGGFVLCERVRPPMQPFCQGDAIILHIDGARFLPDCSTISRVMGAVFDHHYNQVGPDIATNIDLDSNIFEPSYNFHLELRCSTLPPSSTILLKVYTVDRFSLKTVIIGWAALGLFVKSGTETQASTDTSPQQVSLNEGAHQLRLYHQCPAAGTPLCSQTLTSSSRIVPCATVLVRVSRAPTSEAGDPEPQGQTPQLSPRPDYSDGVYHSSSARPTPGEARLLSAMMHRPSVSVRETAQFIAGDSWGTEAKSDEEIGDWILRKLSHTSHIWPQPFNLSLVSHYSCSEGFKVSIDGALNLPWSAFPMGICTLCPPAAPYQGPPWIAYDHPNFIQCPVLKSTNSAPQWSDGFMSFYGRVYCQYMTAIIHLYAVSVVTNEESEPMHDRNDSQEAGLGLKLGQQCWAAVPIFTHGYCNTALYQLPLFSGAPSQEVLGALRNRKCKHVLKDLLQNNEVQLLAGASVFVKVADGRRHQELEQIGAKNVHRSLLPDRRAAATQQLQPTPTPLSQLTPESLQSQPEVFSRLLAKHFRRVMCQELGYHSLCREALKPLGPVTSQ